MAERRSTPGKFDLKDAAPNRLDFDHHREERHRSMTRWESMRNSAADRAPSETDHGWGEHHQRLAGPFSGVGPRGYRRADDRICEELHDRLAAHGFIDATDITCLVQNGEITLNGVVHSRQMKRAAEDVADGIQGVRDVHNNWRIQALADGGPAGARPPRARTR